MAIHAWKSNAELIADCARLGYLRSDWSTLDPTWGHGTFWRLWKPDDLVGSDLDPAKSPSGESVDATALPHVDRFFRVVVLDGPFKLNGTPDASIDKRYGVHEPTRWQDRMELLRDMLVEGARVADDHLLFKCQDQVCSGKVRWQTYEFTKLAERVGFGLLDRLDFLSYRPQPNGTTQQHARRNSSTMLVFKRGYVTSDLA